MVLTLVSSTQAKIYQADKSSNSPFRQTLVISSVDHFRRCNLELKLGESSLQNNNPKERILILMIFIFFPFVYE